MPSRTENVKSYRIGSIKFPGASIGRVRVYLKIGHGFSNIAITLRVINIRKGYLVDIDGNEDLSRWYFHLSLGSKLFSGKRVCTFVIPE